MNKWIKDFPNKPGYYWFFGDAFGKKEFADIHFVKVHKTVNSFAVVMDGHFTYKSEAVGFWMKAELPEYPLKESIDSIFEKENHE